MSSESKIAANRANAQLSTGPRTLEGKAASSLNAFKHGLRSNRLLVLPNEQDEFDQLLTALRAQVNPQGPLEELAFSELLRAAWHLRRVQLAEAALASSPTDPFLTPTCYSTIHRLESYHVKYERSYHRAFRHLQQLQTDRLLREREITGSNESPDSIPACASMSVLNRRTHRKPTTLLTVPAQPPEPPLPLPEIPSAAPECDLNSTL
jgi:hypothetical protein